MRVKKSYVMSDSGEILKPPPNKCRKKTLKRKPIEREWKVEDLPEGKKSHLSWNVSKRNFLTTHWSPTTIFEQFIGDDMLGFIASQSILYAKQKGCMNFSVDHEELRLFLAILLTSGYAKLLRQRLYWDPSCYANNITISSAMLQNRFEQILQYFHLVYNHKLDKKEKLEKLLP